LLRGKGRIERAAGGKESCKQRIGLGRRTEKGKTIKKNEKWGFVRKKSKPGKKKKQGRKFRGLGEKMRK